MRRPRYEISLSLSLVYMRLAQTTVNSYQHQRPLVALGQSSVHVALSHSRHGSVGEYKLWSYGEVLNHA